MGHYIRDINGNYIFDDSGKQKQVTNEGTTQRTQPKKEPQKVKRQKIKVGNQIVYADQLTPKNGQVQVQQAHQSRPDEELQQRIAKYNAEQADMDRRTAQTVAGLGGFANMFFPSHLYGAYKENKPLFEENEGLGDSVANLAFDVITPAVVAKGANLITKGLQYGLNKSKPLISKFKFKSELDWSPESWFGTRPSGIGYDKEDVAELTKHIPEYHKIEKITKANGTWLKMPNGKIWTGDPRSWVQYMSKNVQKHDPEQFWTGIRNSTIDPTYDQQLWGTFGQGKLSAAKARTYATSDSHVLPIFSKGKVSEFSYDAKGNKWYNIDGKRTNDIVDQNFAKGVKTIKINNVTDTGPNIVTPKNSPKYSWGDAMTDYDITNNAGVVQNDIIIAPNSFRKSLLGNNGAFSNSKNWFKGLFYPTILGTSSYSISKQKRGGKFKYYIPKKSDSLI